MKIYGDVISPFVRMCLVTAHEVGLKEKVEWVKTAVKPDQANPDLERLSPAGKIPVLETDHHHAIYDSRVIIEYLAHVAGNSTIIPDDGVKRFRVLTLQALAQGAADAAVALRYEVAARPQGTQWPELADRQARRVRSAIAEVETHWQDCLADVSAGTIALACMLAYVDLRHSTMNWRDGNPKTAKFAADFDMRASMKAWPLA